MSRLFPYGESWAFHINAGCCAYSLFHSVGNIAFSLPKLTPATCTEYELVESSSLFFSSTNGSWVCLRLCLSNYPSASGLLCKRGGCVITFKYLSFVWQHILETNALLTAKTLMRNWKIHQREKKKTIRAKPSARLPPPCASPTI